MLDVLSYLSQDRFISKLWTSIDITVAILQVVQNAALFISSSWMFEDQGWLLLQTLAAFADMVSQRTLRLSNSAKKLSLNFKAH